ncbi:hypothetical protein BH23GEM1_BH23GEM1_05590 [soil metagenome]
MKYLVAVALAAALLAAWLLPRAFPFVVLQDRIDREEALQRSATFVRAHGLPAGARTAVRFEQADSLITFVELAAGGKDSLEALLPGTDVSPYTWHVRHFTPRDVRETQVYFAPNGRPLGFERKLAESDERPELSPDSARRVAEHVLTGWLGEPTDRWRLAATSYETRKMSGRVDRTFTFERTDRRVGGAPIRCDIVIAGDTPSAARRYVRIPEGFARRYGEMQSANRTYGLIGNIGLIAIVLAGAFALRRFYRKRMLRWNPALAVGAAIGILAVAAGLNEMPSAWYYYDTAMSPITFQLLLVFGALLGGAMLGLMTAITLVVAEAATRAAFPDHLDWWKLWRNRGTKQVATRVAGGYALAAMGLAYVAAFYLLTRSLFGWWVPSALLDDPNLIATPAPWLAGIVMSLHAAVWEEALFRALPLSLLWLAVRSHPRRGLWMAAGVIASALVFGFAHSDYPSWPPYSRGMEIFLEACLWGLVFLRFGLLSTVVAHFVYNATLFGAFAAGGTALSYRITAAIIALAVLTPALVLAWRWHRQRGLATAPPEARFGVWQPGESMPEPVAVAAVTPDPTVGIHARKVAFATIAIGIAVALFAPREPVRGAMFTASRTDIARVADSMVTARGANAASWKRLIATREDTLESWPRFVRHHERDGLATSLATSYAIPVWWEARYVRTTGELGQRAEEWRARVRPDGVPMDVEHIVPDSAPGARPDQAEIRRIARAELTRACLDTLRLVGAKLQEAARPARLDATVTYTDSTVRLPDGAAARVRVVLAGTEPSKTRRGIELPEEFVRADRDLLTTRVLVAGISAIILITLVIVGFVRVIRRRQPLIDETDTSPRAVTLVLATAIVLIVASTLNDFPASLFDYDTAESWTSFITSRMVGVIGTGVFLLLLVAGLWLAVNALRRRAGMPVFAPPGAGEGRSDALLAGAAMGSVFAIFVTVLRVTSAFPSAPETALTSALPAAARLLALPPFVLLLLPLVAIPLLLIVALAREWRPRLLLGLLLLALLSGVMLPGSIDPVTPLRIAAGISALVAITLAIRTWGSLGVASWIVAAVTAFALFSLRNALHSANSVDAWAHVLGVVAAAGALALVLYSDRRLASRGLVAGPSQGAG